MEHLNRQLARRLEVPSRRFGPAALEVLKRHAWPGNVRELRNCIESLLLTSTQPDVSAGEAQDALRMSKEPTRRRDEAAPADGATLVDVEREAILGAVRRANGNLAEAARLLRIPRSTLYRKVGC